MKTWLEPYQIPGIRVSKYFICVCGGEDGGEDGDDDDDDDDESDPDKRVA